MSSAERFQPVYALSRGAIAESLHSGAIAVVDEQGRLLASLGDVDQFIFPRSSLKPFQAMPLIEAGGAEHFGLTQSEIALICASHSGTPEHAEKVTEILEKIGLRKADLLCGWHAPYHQKSAEALLIAGEKPSVLEHNCSGKHSGMLALCQLTGWDIADYVDLDHPVQQAARDSFAEWANLPAEELGVGVDGCSAANFAAPLRNTAWAYARLMNPKELAPEKGQAAQIIREAMLAYPHMVGGPGRFDTALMEATQGRILSKAGAEGFQAMGIPAGALSANSPALGIALKIADGDARNWACSAVSLEILRQLELLSKQELDVLQSFGPQRQILNQAGIEVGEAHPVFVLERA